MKDKLFLFDTNVLISALFDNSGKPAKALLKARANGILVISDEVAAEYITVFSKEKFDKYLPKTLRFAFIENIITNSLPVINVSQLKVCRDEQDDKFLSLAVAANVSCIVTGDNDLLVLDPFQNIPILTPATFLMQF